MDDDMKGKIINTSRCTRLVVDLYHYYYEKWDTQKFQFLKLNKMSRVYDLSKIIFEKIMMNGPGGPIEGMSVLNIEATYNFLKSFLPYILVQFQQIDQLLGYFQTIFPTKDGNDPQFINTISSYLRPFGK